MTQQEFEEEVLAFEGVEAHPHFQRIAYRVKDKRIFATLDEQLNSANIYLPVPDQQVFAKMHRSIYPVPNKWGQQGWTTFEISHLENSIIKEALRVGYERLLQRGTGGPKVK